MSVNAVLSGRYLDIALTTTMGVARGGTWPVVHGHQNI